MLPHIKKTKDPNSSLFYLFAYWHDPRWKKFVGASVKIWDLAHNLARQGHSVCLFLPRYRFSKTDLPFDVIEIPFLDLPLLRAGTFNLCLAIYLLFNYPRLQPDVVYLRRTSTLVPRYYAALKKALFFFEVNDDPYRTFEKPTSLQGVDRLRQTISIKIDNINIRAAHRVLVISDKLTDIIADRNPQISRQKFVEMPSGANTELFRPMNRRKAIAAVGLDENLEYVGFVGTLLAHQGVDDLIAAAPGIIKHRPKCRFLVVGEGPMLNSWREEIYNSGLSGVFTFVGAIDYQQVPLWINAMDVCVAPYKQNAGLRSPVKIFDYLACARPVVASRVTGTTDLFAEVSAVRLVSPNSPDELAVGVIDFLEHSESALEKGGTGREWVASNFSRTALSEKVRQAAETLLWRQNKGRRDQI